MIFKDEPWKEALAAAPRSPRDYETAFARRMAPDAQAFSFWNGRTAFYALLNALGIGPGDEVVVPAFTDGFVAHALLLCGARPVYVDPAPGSVHLDLQGAAGAFSDRTRALIVRHTFGIPGPVDECARLASFFGVPAIEDCTQALGSALPGRPLGSNGAAAFFSSQADRPSAPGSGGIAVTRDPELAGNLRAIQDCFVSSAPISAPRRAAARWRSSARLESGRIESGRIEPGRPRGAHGSPAHEGLWRMSPAQADAGFQELNDIDALLAHRRRLAELYDRALTAAGWPVPARPKEAIMQVYPLRVRNKLDLLRQARRACIDLGSGCETPLHSTPLADHFRLGYILGNYPNAEQAAAEIIHLPLHRRTTAAEAGRILDFVFSHASPVR
jgi:dTDP-4-amino-4,6-dideoxygalactose transaminase